MKDCCLASLTTIPSFQLMTSAIVNAFDIKRNQIQARALLDTCASANFITINLVKKLQLPKIKCNVSIGALNNLSTTVNYTVKLTFKSLYNDFKRTLQFFVVPNICDLIPSQTIPREQLTLPSNIKLADPNFHKPAPIDLLIGAGTTLSLFSVGSVNLSQGNNDFYLQKTRLGWIIAGGLDLSKGSNSTDTVNCMISNLQQTIEKFWTVEEVDGESLNSKCIQEEIDCEAHFKKHVTRDKNGRYVVALPFKDSPKLLGESKGLALKRLNSLFRKFNKDPNYKKQYTEAIESYLKANYISPSQASDDSDGYYIPHHAVIKEESSTTKFRVVHNASADSDSGYSLNRLLMTGATIQDKLVSLMLRFRTYIYVLMADIEKMFLQFLIREEDRKYLKFLWLENDEVKEFHWNTVIFGLKSAPFLAIRCLHQLAEDEGHNYPLAAKILLEDLYVDNLITGTNSREEAREIYEQMSKLLSLAQLNMRQWVSNDETVLDGIDESNLDKNFKINKDAILKALGIYWSARNDCFLYSYKYFDAMKRVTKRLILTEIAKLFDPLGLIGPVVLYAKCLMQQLWEAKVTWDESVPSFIYHDWMKFSEQMKSLNNFSFPRKVIIDQAKNVQLHGFSDASEKAYGACIYIRSTDDEGKVKNTLLCAKSRVAPLKKLTIPKLELCGTLLLAELYDLVNKSIKLHFDSVSFWTDSEIVLHWLRMQPNLLKIFVSNRVDQIQDKTKIEQWRHVRTFDNPADGLSRGQLPNIFIKNQLWFNGPEFLYKNEQLWPKSNFKSSRVVLPETKKVNCFHVQINFEILKLFSSFSKMRRQIARIYRFSKEFRLNKGSPKIPELNHAEIVIVKLVQSACFQREIDQLGKEDSVNPKSRLSSLDPFIDKDGLLRVGGRLQNSDISYDRQHPIILPKSHFVTDMIISYYHRNYCHVGAQTTLYALRQKYWLIDGRNETKKIIRQCIICFRARPKLAEYKMGHLPAVRSLRSRAFINVGVDYCGPFYIKERKHKNRNKIKVYVAVFVCMSVKAIHLEVVEDLTTESFIGALRRFVGRRGRPKTIYADNATNFQGANNELNELYSLMKSKEHREKVFNYANNEKIEFHFIPPSSPHFGGLWEAGVRSFKHHFKRVAANTLFTFVEFYTLAIEIEAVLNSRPLTPISTDINDLLALTPGHFLIHDSLMTLPEPDYLPLPSNRLSAWQLISKVRQEFWKRWNFEYLNELNIRQKWKVDTENPKEGMLVLLKEDNVPSMQWPLARIHQLHPGKDGVVRSVTLKVANKYIKRPVRKIAILPISHENIKVT